MIQSKNVRTLELFKEDNLGVFLLMHVFISATDGEKNLNVHECKIRFFRITKV